MSARSFVRLGIAAFVCASAACNSSKKEAPNDAPPPSASASSPPSTSPGALSAASGKTALMAPPPLPPAGPGIPDPQSIVLVDFRKHQINVVVAIVGAGAAHAIRSLYEKGSHTEGEDAGAIAPRMATISYVPLRLPDVRGFKLLVHVYGLTADVPSYPLKSYLPFARGILLVEDDSAADAGGGSWAPFAVSSFIDAKAPPSIALLGPSEFIGQWAHFSASMPTYTAAYRDESFFPALKAVTKGVLMTIRTDGRVVTPTP